MEDSKSTKIAVLGSTGSIGVSALDVIRRHPDRFELVLIAAHANRKKLTEQAAEFKGVKKVLLSEHSYDPADDILPEEALEEIVCSPDVDLVLVALSGSSALRYCLSALRAGKIVALATKEVLVMAGEYVVQECKGGCPGQLRPVDSEHSAIWQSLWGEKVENVSRLVITASGGPFYFRPELDLNKVTVDQALAHPRWRMGPKVTIDAATLMNKGLEVIEAHHLFGVEYKNIDVIVHPQSIIHSMVEFKDGCVKAQLAWPDMKLPIAISLAYPDRLESGIPQLDFREVGKLEFHELDTSRFPAVRLAYEAGMRGGTWPAVLNAANEVAVRLFLQGGISFKSIIEIVEATLSAHVPQGSGLDAVLEADTWARSYVERTLVKQVT